MVLATMDTRISGAQGKRVRFTDKTDVFSYSEESGVKQRTRRAKESGLFAYFGPAVNLQSRKDEFEQTILPLIFANKNAIVRDTIDGFIIQGTDE